MKLPIILMSVSLVMLGGCATTITNGNHRVAHLTRASVQKDLVKGVTTKAQVESLYGSPVTTEFTSNGDLEWIYNGAKDKPDAKEFIPFVGAWLGHDHITTKTLAILFTKHNVVKNYSFTAGKSTIKNGG